MSLVYAQRTGDLYADGQWVTRGYSGADPDGKNQPSAQEIPDCGPIPCGQYTITSFLTTTQEHGPDVMTLEPNEGTNTFGRSGFLIHGDSKTNPGKASKGCIVLSHFARDFIWGSGIRLLIVVPEVQDANATPPDGIKNPFPKETV